MHNPSHAGGKTTTKPEKTNEFETARLGPTLVPCPSFDSLSPTRSYSWRAARIQTVPPAITANQRLRPTVPDNDRWKKPLLSYVLFFFPFFFFFLRSSTLFKIDLIMLPSSVSNHIGPKCHFSIDLDNTFEL